MRYIDLRDWNYKNYLFVWSSKIFVGETQGQILMIVSICGNYFEYCSVTFVKILPSDVPPLEDMSELINQVNNLRENVTAKPSIDQSVTANTQPKKKTVSSAQVVFYKILFNPSISMSDQERFLFTTSIQYQTPIDKNKERYQLGDY